MKGMTKESYLGQKIRELDSDSENTELEEISRSLSVIKKRWIFFPSYIMWLCGLLGCFLYFYYSAATMQRLGLGLIGLAIYNLAYRSGLYYGFTRGYEDGHEMGVRKALGITQEEAEAINERAIQIKVDSI